MSREAPAPFCERLAGKFRQSTHHSLHWTLDVSFREDECRIRKEAAPENFAIMRHIALNLLKSDTTVNASVKRKKLMAALDDDLREAIIRQALQNTEI